MPSYNAPRVLNAFQTSKIGGHTDNIPIHPYISMADDMVFVSILTPAVFPTVLTYTHTHYNLELIIFLFHLPTRFLYILSCRFYLSNIAPYSPIRMSSDIFCSFSLFQQNVILHV